MSYPAGDTIGKLEAATSPMISMSGGRRQWCRCAQPPPKNKDEPAGFTSAIPNV
ncbi:MAG: hypothetical protein KIH69_000705 [Anaerolineae bacterium]|nr:hypothetical protein [Anaerolineae bacterium]